MTDCQSSLPVDSPAGIPVVGRRELLRGAAAFAAGAAVVGASPISAQSAPPTERFFPGFRVERIAVDGATIHAVVAGSGPPVLLLHGAPQSHCSWYRVAGELARDYTVVVADLRGYGDSSKPEGSATHIEYSKRTMAADQVAVMRHLGFERFSVLGHDRGGRVTHRLVLDHPERIVRAAVLDIVPTYYLYTHVTKEWAESSYHWLFFSRPAPFPETVIAASLEQFVGRGETELRDEYLRVFRIPGTVHGMCEDYRAGASIDLDHDVTDINRRIECPLLVLWGANGPIARRFNVLGIWRERGTNVSGKVMPGGHTFQYESPRETLVELRAFLAA